MTLARGGSQAVQAANSYAFRGRAGRSTASRKEETRRGQPCPQTSHPIPWEDPVAYLRLCCYPR